MIFIYSLFHLHTKTLHDQIPVGFLKVAGPSIFCGHSFTFGPLISKQFGLHCKKVITRGLHKQYYDIVAFAIGMNIT